MATLIFRYFLRYFSSTHRTDLSRFRGTFHSFDPVGFAIFATSRDPGGACHGVRREGRESRLSLLLGRRCETVETGTCVHLVVSHTHACKLSNRQGSVSRCIRAFSQTVARTPMPLMSESGLVSRVSPVQTALRNCTRDEGRSFEVGNQVLISSHRKLLSSKAMVVNVAEKSGQDSGRQG